MHKASSVFSSYLFNVHVAESYDAMGQMSVLIILLQAWMQDHLILFQFHNEDLQL